MADQFDRDSAESAAALIELGTLAHGVGDAADAEQTLRRALEGAERELGPDDPALVPPLAALGTVLLARGAAEEAERLFVRLYAIKRAKGEEHPEVATVLASLALARQALGRHDAAEQLWRRVVEIRERTLAPNHFATATALEHLGEACAARGKFREGETFLLRALAIRQVTLGLDHPSFRQARERIADLQLQAAEASLPGLAADAPLARFEPDDAAERQLDPRAGDSTYLDELQELQRALDRDDDEDDAETATDRPGSFVDAAREELRKPPARTTLSGGLIALVLAAVAASSSPRRAPVPVLAAQPSSDYRDARLPLTIMPLDSAVGAAIGAPTASATGGASQPAAASIPGPRTTPLAVPIAGAVSTRTATRARDLAARAASDRRRREASRRTDDEPRAPRPVVPRPHGLDSIVRPPNMHIGALDSFSARLASRDRLGSPRLATGPEAAGAPTHARVIGEVPRPAYPAVLREQNLEGDVTVSFLVDTMGRPDMSSLVVVRASHPRFADAVRDVIPHVRFEPARPAGTGSPAKPEVVILGFRFQLKQR